MIEIYEAGTRILCPGCKESRYEITRDMATGELLNPGDVVAGKNVYRIDGKEYVLTDDQPPQDGDYIVLTSPAGMVGRVKKAHMHRPMVVNVWDQDDEMREMDVSHGDYFVLTKRIINPCPWCGDELRIQSEWDEVRMVPVRHKHCDECGAYGHHYGNRYEWWNADEQVFDPGTKEILHNPNYLEEDDTEWDPR